MLKNKELNDVTILVNSCDLYEDAWRPFFVLLRTQWPKCPYRILLNTEKKSFIYEGVEVLNTGEDTWSKRVINALHTIETEYVLFFLEDFFLMSEVQEDLFDEALSLIKKNNQVGMISFNPEVSKAIWHTKRIRGEQHFEEVKKTTTARINAVCALWRKDFFLKVLQEEENPWEFESNGTERAKKYKEKVLCLRDDLPKVFNFRYCIGSGYGISQKSWLPKNKELFEKYDIEVDFERLGWYKTETKKRVKRTTKDKIKLIYKNPEELMQMVITKIKNKLGIK